MNEPRKPARPTQRGKVLLGVLVLAAVVAVGVAILVLGPDAEDPAADSSNKEARLPGALAENQLPRPPAEYDFKVNQTPEPGRPYYQFHAKGLESEDPYNIVSFYQEEMAALGWLALTQDGTDEGVVTLQYEKDKTVVQIDILADPPNSGEFSVRIAVCPPQPKSDCQS